ncbi:MAG: hypothetical protein EXR62_14640 [Chloroflexi bacterium]|nr:hypothetical protein [Chloroflexota bacterium]
MVRDLQICPEVDMEEMRKVADMRPDLALIGGEEFADGFEDVHAGLLAELGGGLRRVVYLPTCAADDGAAAVDYWCTLAREKLSAIGAHVETPRVVDVASANDSGNAQLVAEADWIYLGGGYPHVAMKILPGTQVLEALYTAAARGALICGASAGAMLMCARSSVMTPELIAAVGRALEDGPPDDWQLPPAPPLDCLGLLPGTICAPHFDRIGIGKWFEGFLQDGMTLLGVDEQTALVHTSKGWEVRGRGAVTILRHSLEAQRYGADTRLDDRFQVLGDGKR